MSKAMKRLLGAAALVFAVLTAAVFLYINDYYHADETALQATNSTDMVEVSEVENGLLFDGAGDDAAVIFYPGAKVEYTAYAPLMMRLAENGIDCFLIKMPCNLAIFGLNSADRIISEYEYAQWYLAGHSLGGAMAASYSAEHLEELNGLILLAAYSTKSLQSDDFAVLSIYGSEDGVLNFDKLQMGRTYLPENSAEEVIDGGNHAGFGSYGKQDGDGTARISQEEQWEQTAVLICGFIK